MAAGPVNGPRYQLLPNRPLERAQVVVLPVPLERTVSYRGGTAAAPAAILEATAQLEYYEEDLGWSPFRHLGVRVEPAIEPAPGEDSGAYLERLARATAAVPPEALLLGLGGEHSITPGLVAGRMVQPGTVLFLDAHADLREHYEGSAHSHACPVHHLRAAGHRVLLVGVRSLLDAEAQRIAADPGLCCYPDRGLQRGGLWPELLADLKALEGPLWLSVDMDAFDPAAVPGVGTPQPGGLSWHQVMDVLEAALLNPRVELRGADLVELVPEPSRVSDMTAAKLTQKIISLWGWSRGYPAAPENGSQMEVDYY